MTVTVTVALTVGGRRQERERLVKVKKQSEAWWNPRPGQHCSLCRCRSWLPSHCLAGISPVINLSTQSCLCAELVPWSTPRSKVGGGSGSRTSSSTVAALGGTTAGPSAIHCATSVWHALSEGRPTFLIGAWQPEALVDVPGQSPCRGRQSSRMDQSSWTGIVPVAIVVICRHHTYCMCE